MAKEFKKLDEQTKLLSSRGLNISDDKEAQNFLLNNNYYRVSGYSLTLRKHDKFHPKAKMEDIMEIYNFDHEFRHILLKYIGIIEVRIKSVYAYEFSKMYGPLGYRSGEHFTNYHEHLKILNKANVQMEKNLSYEACIKHFVEELHEDLPLWAFVELMTISDISKLYEITDEDVQKEVVKVFSLRGKKAPEILVKILHGIVIVRNLCAHESRLYNRIFITKPSLSSDDKKLLNITKSGKIDNSHLFGHVLNMRRILTVREFENLKNEINDLCVKYPFVNMKYYGFNPNWYNSI